MKPKATKFKNPFDLMEEQQQQIIDIKPQNNNSQPYIPKGKVHAPLPFNPFESTIEQAPSHSQTFTSKDSRSTQSSASYSNIIKQTKKNATKPKGGFANPFGHDLQVEQHQTFTPSAKSPVIGFNPQQTPQYIKSQPQQNHYNGPLNQDGDPPLLEDIGIDIGLIKQRILMTIKLQKPQYEQLENADLAGPILIALAFGCLLLLSGKMHFGDIYAMFLFGNSIMYFLINFMNQSDVIPLYSVMSTLGYSLLPMLALGLVGIVFDMRGSFGIFFSLLIAAWSSLSAGNTLQVHLRQPHNNRKFLIVYPSFLFYLCFVMIVIF